MPELPEVETICRGLRQRIDAPSIIKAVQLNCGDFRVKVRPEEVQCLIGKKILQIRRRAKYLLFELEDYILVNHLGMTGTWRDFDPENVQKHDHFIIKFKNGKGLVFNDPRRFGLIQVLSRNQEKTWVASQRLGPEPLQNSEFNKVYLYEVSRLKKNKVKTWLMDQSVVVGVGNIYASEVLFRAGVSPIRTTNTLTKNECEKICHEVKLVLEQALQKGGSSLRDYYQASGQQGQFQREFQVYNRKGESCMKCKARKVENTIITGRSSYWCPGCQK
ncbi:MAG: bifunctional DNA-formamidopyrimidine glycosylase/DNA-(apurinic or apyrimidinic site) lyase [Bdellovibrionales bacterium]|nr:bifunctional DNA-formamidopyrimidine glycosylase/DNA-(apurinic or apyrimidinic site) lyase [Bdellovibrionales bacterium]